MTLSLRPDDRGALMSMQKWPNSGVGWGNHQHGSILETSLSPLFYAPQQLQPSQSMFPQLMGPAEQQAAFLQAFVQANVGEQGGGGGSLDSLLNSSRSSSMVDTTSEMTPGDDDCTAPENNLHNMTCINPSLASVLASRLDRDGASTGASLMNAAHAHNSKEYFRMESPGGPLSPGALPCGEHSEDSLHGGDAMAGLKRRLGDGDEHEDHWMADQMMLARGKLQKLHQQQISEKALGFGQDSFGDFQTPSVPGTYSSAMQHPPPPFLQSTGNGGGSEASDMDKLVGMRAILFRHASQPIPSLEEIASSRPKRRNVRISKDPQSVAARHRRERISDRMRVLQRLVPGGTKMDTASMLDEAIHYVKFLKLQLQTLEQMGSNVEGCDLRFAQQGASGAQELAIGLARPFDLNCSTAAFQAWPGTTMGNSNEAGVMSQQTGHTTQWASDANQAFSDATK